MPATPADAKGLLKTAIRDNNPVLFFEDKMMYRQTGPVPAEEYTIPFGVAEVKRPGDDITLLATSSMVQVALEAAERLATEDISAEVIDPRTLTPLDEETLVSSVKKTSRCIVIDEGYRRFGAGAELVAVVSNKAFYYLDAPVERVGALDVPVPFSPVLEDQTIPGAERVVQLARQLVWQ
jgi:pyruvate dehydrogenase E1 component beta subunit